MAKFWQGAQSVWSKVGQTFANPLATVLGKNKDSSNFFDDINFKASNPLGQVGSVGRDILQKKITPAPITPTVIPMPDQEAIDEAARKSRQRQLGRTGFDSTILSAASGTQQPTSDRLGP